MTETLIGWVKDAVRSGAYVEMSKAIKFYFLVMSKSRLWLKTHHQTL